MKLLLNAFLILVLQNNAFCREAKKFDNKFIGNNAIELNAGGHGIFYSIAYERFIINRNRYKLSAHIGISYYPPAADFARLFWLPLSIKHLISFGTHHAEIGMGVMFAKDEFVFRRQNNFPYKNHEMFGIFSVGYRHQKVNKPFYYKISLTPVIEGSFGYVEIHPIPSLSFGYLF